jgi:hypothetical protein
MADLKKQSERFGCSAVCLVSVVSCQLSFISYQLSVVAYQFWLVAGLGPPLRDFLSRNVDNSKELPLGC